jgi:hypothetical protein
LGFALAAFASAFATFASAFALALAFSFASFPVKSREVIVH